MTHPNPTAQNILSIARLMLMTRGYQGFSFRDISSQAGIKAASIHYHFPTKADLAEALLSQASREFQQQLADIIEKKSTAADRLQGLVGIFERTYGDADRLCLICMLASGQDTVPLEIRDRIRVFWNTALDWIEQRLDEGMRAGEFRQGLDSRVVAQTLLAGLEGAMLIGRSFQDTKKLSESAGFLLSCLR